MTSEKMMTEKWRLAFMLMDFNKDGVISVADKDGCRQSFLDTYKPTDKEPMCTAIDAVWDKCTFLNQASDWGAGPITQEAFIASRKTAFQSDQGNMASIIRGAMTGLLKAVDFNGSGMLSFEEFKKMHVAFGLADEKFIKLVFGAVGGKEDVACSGAAVAEFYTELTVGQDADKHAAVTSALMAAGIPIL